MLKSPGSSLAYLSVVASLDIVFVLLVCLSRSRAMDVMSANMATVYIVFALLLVSTPICIVGAFAAVKATADRVSFYLLWLHPLLLLVIMNVLPTNIR